jgi:hypothetical protein
MGSVRTALDVIVDIRVPDMTEVPAYQDYGIGRGDPFLKSGFKHIFAFSYKGGGPTGRFGTRPVGPPSGSQGPGEQEAGPVMRA